MTQTLSEQFVGQPNTNVFFTECAFASNRLRIEGVGEVELADHLAVLDEFGLIFQPKERSTNTMKGLQRTLWSIVRPL